MSEKYKQTEMYPCSLGARAGVANSMQELEGGAIRLTLTPFTAYLQLIALRLAVPQFGFPPPPIPRKS